jgi:hypothetical protein
VLTGLRISLAAQTTITQNRSGGEAPEVPMGEEVMQTTTFHDETIQETFDYLAKTDVDTDLWKSATTPGMETVVNLLEKPSLIATTQFATTDTTYIADYSFPNVLLSKLKNSARLNGVTFMRADVEVEIKVNATKFQAGRYILAFVPLGGVGSITDPGSTPTNLWWKAHLANLQAVTSLPHVEIDLSTQTSAKLDIPFTAFQNFFTTQATTNRTFARLVLYCYSPLLAGSGSTIAQVAIWARFKNIHLSGNAVLQSAISKKELKQKDGPISSVTTKVEKTANALGVVPLLAPAARIVGWAAALAGDVARIWGYSKPTDNSVPTRMFRQAISYMPQADGVFTGKKLSLFSDQAVTINSDRARTKVDEMSFDFLKSIPVWFRTIAWPNTATAGTVLTYIDMVPNGFSVNIGKGFTEPPFATLLRSFLYWRGSLVIKIKLVKTEFHSGRLQFSFQPWSFTLPNQPTTLTLEQTDNLYRHIVDIRETNEVEFCVPFISEYNYLSRGVTMGRVWVHVVNELIAPSTVPSSVPLLFEVSAGEDFEFVAPVQDTDIESAQYQPYVPAVTQSNVMKILCKELGVGNMTPGVALESVGEKVVSLRTLLKRAHQMVTVANGGVRMILAPFNVAVVTQNTDNTTALLRAGTGAVSYSGDIFDYWNMCYLFSSGNMRVYFANDDPTKLTGNATMILAKSVLDRCPVTVDSLPFDGTMKPVDFATQNIDGMYNVEVPSYITGGVRNNIAQMVGSTAGISAGQHFPLSGMSPTAVVLKLPALADNTLSGPVYRSAADDYNMSRFCGIVPIVLSTTA